MAAMTAHERADWQRVSQLYAQLVQVLAKKDLDEELTAALADAMARLCAAYDEEEVVFVEHLLEVMHEVDPQARPREERFVAYYHDRRYQRFTAYQSRADRRRPTPYEAAVETCRRLRDINRLRAQLAPVPTGCVLGGSASYGRFFNTVGVKDNTPSDIDFILVVDDYSVLRRLVDALERVEGIREQDLVDMRHRVESFPEARALLEEGDRCVFSHKLKLWPPGSPDRLLAGTDIGGSYDLSLHVLDGGDIDYLILRDRPRLDEERKILDFRATLPETPDLQRSFAGTEVLAERKGRPCPGGYLVPSHVCQVEPATSGEGTRYHPGQLQNLILPEFEVRWELDTHRLYLPLYSFKVKLRERLEFERRERPYEIQNLSNSHTRRFMWAPYVSDRVNKV